MANRVGVSGTGSGVHWFASNPWMIVTTPPCAMQRGWSMRETSSSYWSLGRMQEDWDGMHALVRQLAVPPSDPPSSSIVKGGVSPMWQSNGCQLLLLTLCPGLILGILLQQASCLWLGQWGSFVRASFGGWLAALPAMMLDGLGCDWGTANALLAHQAQLVVYHLQMVDDHSLILPFLPTPQTVGYPVEMIECVRMVDTG